MALSSEKMTPGTRALMGAKTHMDKILVKLEERHGHTPLLHKKVDPRTHKKAQQTWMEMGDYLRGEMKHHYIDKPRAQRGQNERLRETSRRAAMQSIKNRAAGRPEQADTMAPGGSYTDQMGSMGSSNTPNVEGF